MPDYLRVQDIVKSMGVSEETVRSWIRRKLLPAIRIGRDYFIDPKDWEQFLASRRTTGRTAEPEGDEPKPDEGS